MVKLKLDNRNLMIAASILIVLFFLYFFQFTGLRLIIGIFLVFFLPFYLILSVFDFEEWERWLFSFFLGIGLFSTLVYNIGLISSLKTGIVLSFVLLIALSVLLRKYKKRK